MYGRTVEIDRRNAARRITRIGIADNRIIHQIQTSRPRLKINSATSIGFIGKRTAFRSQPIIDECIIDKCTYHILRLARLRINPVPATDIIGYRIPRQQGKNHTVRISRTTLCRPILHEIGIRYMRPPTRRSQIKCSTLRTGLISSKHRPIYIQISPGIYSTSIRQSIIITQLHIFQNEVYSFRINSGSAIEACHIGISPGQLQTVEFHKTRIGNGHYMIDIILRARCNTTRLIGHIVPVQISR